MKVWALDGSCRRVLPEYEEAVSDALMLADEHTIVTGCEDDTIRLWDLDKDEYLQTLDASGDGVCRLCHGPLPHTFLSGCRDGSILMWSIIYELEFDSMAT